MKAELNSNYLTSEHFDSLRVIAPGVSLADLQRHVATRDMSGVWMTKSLAIAGVTLAIVAAGWFLIPQRSMPNESAMLNTQRPPNQPARIADGSESNIIAAPFNRVINKIGHLAHSIAKEISLSSAENQQVNSPDLVASQADFDASVRNSHRQDVSFTAEQTFESMSAATTPENFSVYETLRKNANSDAGHSFNKPAIDPDQSRVRISGELQAGAIMGTLNTPGGGLGIRAEYDAFHVGLRYTSTFGTLGNSSELFRNLNDGSGRTYSQSITEFALLFGGTIRQGNFWATLCAGPTRTKASFNSTNFGTSPNQLIPSSAELNGTGARAEASFGFKFNEYLGAELTGFASNHTQTYGGILLSVVVGDI